MNRAAIMIVAEIRVHFFAGEKMWSDRDYAARKNRGIVQCAHWTMNMPPACSITHSILSNH